MWRRVGLLYTGVSEESVDSIFSVKEITQAKKSVRRLLTDWLQVGGPEGLGWRGCGKVKPTVSAWGRRRDGIGKNLKDFSQRADTVPSRQVLPMLSGVSYGADERFPWLAEAQTNISVRFNISSHVRLCLHSGLVSLAVEMCLSNLLLYPSRHLNTPTIFCEVKPTLFKLRGCTLRSSLHTPVISPLSAFCFALGPIGYNKISSGKWVQTFRLKILPLSSG
jgi:hypothetical protein